MERSRGPSLKGDTPPSAFVGPLALLRLAFSQSLFRLSPAWCFLAGLAASGHGFTGQAPGTPLLGILLVEVAWGLARAAATPGAAPTAVGSLSTALPYMQPRAPLARLSALFGAQVDPAQLHSALFGALVAGVLSWRLGPAAWGATGIVFASIVVAGRLAHAGRDASLFAALLDVGVPWLLGLGLGWAALWRDGGLDLAAGAPLLLAGAGFTLLQWGAYRGGRPALLGLGSVMVGSAVLWLGHTLALLGAVLALAPTLRLIGWSASRSPSVRWFWTVFGWWGALWLLAWAARVAQA